MKEYTKQFIGGQWREGTGKGMINNYNPLTGKLLYSYRSASQTDVDEAYAAAVKAQREWAATPPAYKKEMLQKLIEVWLEMKDDFIAALIEEGGSTKVKYDFEYYDSINVIQDALHYPYMMDGAIMPSNVPDKENYIFRSPKGVICVIAPYNFPVLLAMRSVAPAVACGNAVVLKPATDTPASAMLIAEAFDRAGFPKGLVNAVAGKGSDIGDYIVEHPVPSLVSFTGSTQVGQRIGALASSKLKDISLELGGNNTMIVLDDADVEQASKAAIFGAYCHQGQVCMCLNRVIATPRVYEKFVETFVAMSKAQKVGNPAEADTFIGPIINESQVKNIEKIIQETIAAGAVVALKGKTEGNLIYPWVFSEVTNEMAAARLEVFGPVCAIIRAKNEQDAIHIANDTEYGLSNSVFTQDLYHGMQVARQMESGMVHVNDQPINHEAHVMFGGEKYSGVGRFNGPWVVHKFTTEKWVSVQTKDRF
jgi:aldehyde dehydrogenase (NAD+)